MGPRRYRRGDTVFAICVAMYMVLTLYIHIRQELTLLHLKLDTEDEKEVFSRIHNVTAIITTALPSQDIDNKSLNGPEGKIQTTTPVAFNFTLRKFDKSRPLVFLHIGKNGGTSFDKAMKTVNRQLRARYIGHKHFDWSYIEQITNADVLLLLREPVARAVSHYFFMRKWSKTLNKKTLTDYFKNSQDMLDTRDVWQDGQAAVSWLTGTHIARWVGCKPDQVPVRERMSLNITQMCLLAAKRLENIFWFGIIEDQQRSFELLKYQLGLQSPISFPKSNSNRHVAASKNESDILASLIPQDLWLYQYAKLLFEARWTFYKTGVYNHPQMPPLPTHETIPCISTRFILLCKSGPLSPLYHVDPHAAIKDQVLPEDILKKLNLDSNFFKISKGS